MDFALTDEQKQLREILRAFAKNELAPHAAKNDRECIFPSDAIKKLGEMGFMGMLIPPEYGGSGMDVLSYVIAIEEISRVDASVGVILSVNNSLVCEVLKNFGTEDQKKNYLRPLAQGAKLGAYCLTEPMSGSDAATMKTTAKFDGSTYRLNGAKNWITNGPQADVFIVFCMTKPELGTKGISAFIVDRETQGLEIGKDENKLGIRASGTCTISFTDSPVSASNRIGDEGAGFKIAMATLDGGRIGIAAQALGIAQASLDEAIKYAKERRAFDQSISEFQGIRWMITDMATEVEAARLLTYQAAYRKSHGGRYTKWSAMAKLFSSETASRVARRALQIHGGYGFTKEYPIERYLRDARITEIYEGTSEIQRLVIASNLLKEMAI